mgnify:CR=1 FL=1
MQDAVRLIDQNLQEEKKTDALLTELWRQVGLLHRAGIAHGELVPANCMVDTDGRPWLVDFDQSRVVGQGPLLERDRTELLAALSALVGQTDVRGDPGVAGHPGDRVSVR